MHKNSQYYKRLKNILLTIIILLAVLPMMFMGWTASRYYKKYALDNMTIALTSMVENRKEVISLFLKNQKHLMTTLVHLFPLGELRDQEYLEKLFVAINGGGVIVDLGVIDANGEHLAYVGPYKRTLSNKNYREAAWFQEVMLSGSHISDVFTGYRGIPHFVVAVADPLKKWVLRATINSQMFNSLLESAQMDPRGDAYIINKRGEFQTPSLLGSRRLLPLEAELLTPHEGTTIRTIADTLYATCWVKENSWLLVIKTDLNRSLATFDRTKRLNLLMVTLAVLLVITAAGLIVRFIVQRIEAADLQKSLLDSRLLQVEKMTLIGKLAASVAHEVNNPLQMIGDQAGWMAELLEEEDRDRLKHTAEYDKSLQKIRYHIKRAAKVTHRLLGFSKKMETEWEAVNINKLLLETVSFLENEAQDHNILIAKNFQNDLPTTMTDGQQLQQVFLNVIDNALDAVGKEGRIDISTKLNGANLIVHFEDSGPGIEPEVMPKIFSPFFTTKGRGKGTGLGLAICYNIMQKLGGEINVKNREEGGTDFIVTLPCIQLDDQLLDRQRAGGPAMSGKGERQ